MSLARLGGGQLGRRWKPPQRGMPPGTDSVLSANRRKPHYSGTFVCLMSLLAIWGHDSDCSVENAVDPQNFEPNLALCLEIADLINSKKGNAYVILQYLWMFTYGG